MKKKLFLFAMIFYLIIGVWFYTTVIKNPNVGVQICPPQNIITKEVPQDQCRTQKFTLKQEVLGAFNAVIFWFPMIVGTGLGGG